MSKVTQSTPTPTPTPTPTRGVVIVLDKERRLRYSLGTIRKMREEFGDNVLESGLPHDAIGKLLWFGLVHDDENLTPGDVEELVDLEHLDEIMKAVTKATGGRSRIELIEAGTKLSPAPPPQQPVAKTTEATGEETKDEEVTVSTPQS